MKKLLLTACLLSAVSLNIKAQKGESAASLNALLDVTESGDCVLVPLWLSRTTLQKACVCSLLWNTTRKRRLGTW